MYVATTVLWTAFEVLARVSAVIMFSVGYQAWVFVALGTELLLRWGLVSAFVAARLGPRSRDAAWVRALRQMLAHEVDAVDSENAAVDRPVFVLLTLLVQGALVTLPLINDIVPALYPGGTPLAPGPQISGLCVLTGAWVGLEGVGGAGDGPLSVRPQTTSSASGACSSTRRPRAARASSPCSSPSSPSSRR